MLSLWTRTVSLDETPVTQDSCYIRLLLLITVENGREVGRPRPVKMQSVKWQIGIGGLIGPTQRGSAWCEPLLDVATRRSSNLGCFSVVFSHSNLSSQHTAQHMRWQQRSCNVCELYQFANKPSLFWQCR